jgi:hypothetical protein
MPVALDTSILIEADGDFDRLAKRINLLKV